MSRSSPLFSLAAAGATAFTLVAALFISPNFAEAAEAPVGKPACDCAAKSKDVPTRPRVMALNAPLDEADELAALESVQFALTQVADGSSYVWHRSHGRLSGIVKPLSSYKLADGSVCRRIVVIFSSLDTSKRTTTRACRLDNGIWQLEG